MKTNTKIVAYVITGTGLTIVWNDHRPSSINEEHPRFNEIAKMLLDPTPDVAQLKRMVDTLDVIEDFISPTGGKLTVCRRTRQVFFSGKPISAELQNVLMKLIDHNENPVPFAKFIENLHENPSETTVKNLYGWVEHNGLKITEDGHLIAYKRVNANMRSFFDDKTNHPIGGYVEMERSATDEDNSHTCSRGLHFCSHAYLPHYHGGSGRVVILKIDPKDIVAIPEDYAFAKGRACRYRVLGELVGTQRKIVENADVVHGMIYKDSNLCERINAHGEQYVAGYISGYKAGRNKKRNIYRSQGITSDEVRGYTDGFADGKNRLPQKY